MRTSENDDLLTLPCVDSSCTGHHAVSLSCDYLLLKRNIHLWVVRAYKMDNKIVHRCMAQTIMDARTEYNCLSNVFTIIRRETIIVSELSQWLATAHHKY